MFRLHIALVGAAWLMCAWLMGLSACGDGVGNDGDLVGGACRDSADCAERCVTGDDFPEGTCVIRCETDADCPTSTHCVDDRDGICLLGCDLPEHCRRGYTCKGKENKGHGGDSLVCIAD